MPGSRNSSSPICSFPWCWQTDNIYTWPQNTRLDSDKGRGLFFFLRRRHLLLSCPSTLFEKASFIFSSKPIFSRVLVQFQPHSCHSSCLSIHTTIKHRQTIMSFISSLVCVKWNKVKRKTSDTDTVLKKGFYDPPKKTTNQHHPARCGLAAALSLKSREENATGARGPHITALRAACLSRGRSRM